MLVSPVAPASGLPASRNRNVELLRNNRARFGDRVEVIPAAVWPDDALAPELAPLSLPMRRVN